MACFAHPVPESKRPFQKTYQTFFCRLLRQQQGAEMKFTVKRKIRLSFYWIIVLIGIAGLSWTVSIFVLTRMASSTSDVVRYLFDILYEIAKAITIGSTAGILLNHLLERASERSPQEILSVHGMQEILPSRIESAKILKEHVQDASVKTVWLLGISLRDFLTYRGTLDEVWEAIVQRLKAEENNNVPPSSRLRVQLLLLDPRSAEGRFRINVERSTIQPGGLNYDVRIGLEQIRAVMNDIYRSAESEYLQVRLYHHGSFAFQFISDTSAFIEQYSYRDHSTQPSFPLIQYRTGTEQYKELFYSYSKIWSKAHSANLRPHDLGIAQGIENSQIKHIFRHDARDLLGRRQMACFNQAQQDDVINIQSISGRFYSREPALEMIQNLSLPWTQSDTNSQGARIRLLIMNPLSQQAILRAIADTQPESITVRLRQWDWTQHTRSRLYADIGETIRQVKRLIDTGGNIELRLSSGTISCSLVLTEDAAFIEQYIYGRSERYYRGIVLGGEYPVFEYKMNRDNANWTTEEEILRSSFEVVWEHLSIGLSEYEGLESHSSYQQLFERNLDALLAEMNIRNGDQQFQI